ncbi:MAG: hypothetical protein ABR530_05655, partial [Pyrinomonadaceae bacterium]
MNERFTNEADIHALLRSFEKASISRDGWKHAEHLVVALCYVTQHDLEAATAKMRAGILHLLEFGFQVDLGKEMPYHETITAFWMRAVAQFNDRNNGTSLLDKANTLVKAFD